VEAMWGVTVESEFGFQQDWECSENSRKRETSDSVSASSANLKVSPYFQQPQFSHGFEITIKPQINNKRKRLPKTKAKAKPIVTADGRRVSPFFQKNDQVEGEGGIAIISSNNKVKTKAKALAPNNKRLVSPYFLLGKNDIAVAIKSKTKAYRHFQPQEDQCPSPLKKKCGDTASMNKKRLVSPYFLHEIDDIVVVSKRKPTLKKKKENNPTYLRKSPDNGTASMNKKRLVSPYFPHEIDDIVVVSKRKPTLKKKKEKNPAYLRKSPDNVWIPPKSVHALLQEKYYEDPWKVLVICMLLNKTSGTQAKNVLQDLFELCPNAEAATMVEIKEIRKVIQSLGLQNMRSKKIKVLSEEYLRDDWTYVSDLTGIGKYASDAYAIFCTGNWKEVVPDDHKLVPYWEDLWKSEKMGNCCRD